MPCRRHCIPSGSSRVGSREPNYRTQAMDEGQHERLSGKNEAWLSHCQPEAENFLKVPDEFSFQGSGLKTLS